MTPLTTTHSSRPLKPWLCLLSCLIIAACQPTSTDTAAKASKQPLSAKLQSTKQQSAQLLSTKQQLGKLLFFDTNLSSPSGQACASCHSPTAGFADPNQQSPISSGVIPGRFANRNAPSIAYASFAPPLQYDNEKQMYIGGLFLDGRTNTLEEQAKHPFLNPLEMANPDQGSVVTKVKQASYAKLFKQLYGDNAFDDIPRAFDLIASSIASYERSTELKPFRSKYDDYLAGIINLSPQELRGLKLFEDENKGNCAACHPNQPSDDGAPPLLTDFTYDNIGVPKNPLNPFYQQAPSSNPAGKHYVDNGLGDITNDPSQNGKFKVSTLRNIALTAPYMHNGVFKTLKEVVEFYNTRDVSNDWAAPEITENMNTEELGDLKLTEQEVDDLVAFLKTLSDH